MEFVEELHAREEGRLTRRSSIFRVASVATLCCVTVLARVFLDTFPPWLPWYLGGLLLFAVSEGLVMARTRARWIRAVEVVGDLSAIFVLYVLLDIALASDAEAAQRTLYSLPPTLLLVVLAHSLRDRLGVVVVTTAMALLLFVAVHAVREKLALPQTFGAVLIASVGAVLVVRIRSHSMTLARLQRLQRLRRFLSPAAVERVLRESPDAAMSPGGRRVLVTLVAVELPIEETAGLDPEKLVKAVNGVRRTLVEVADRYEGVLDKFIGAGALIVFGLPEREGEGPPDAGANAALSFARDLLSAFKADERRAELAMGIHTGEVVAGNLGSESSRLEFTVIGDPVNTTARLKELARSRGEPLLVSESTLERATHREGWVALERVVLRGKGAAMQCFAQDRAERVSA